MGDETSFVCHIFIFKECLGLMEKVRSVRGCPLSHLFPDKCEEQIEKDPQIGMYGEPGYLGNNASLWRPRRLMLCEQTKHEGVTLGPGRRQQPRGEERFLTHPARSVVGCAPLQSQALLSSACWWRPTGRQQVGTVASRSSQLLRLWEACRGCNLHATRCRSPVTDVHSVACCGAPSCRWGEDGGCSSLLWLYIPTSRLVISEPCLHMKILPKCTWYCVYANITSVGLMPSSKKLFEFTRSQHLTLIIPKRVRYTASLSLWVFPLRKHSAPGNGDFFSLFSFSAFLPSNEWLKMIVCICHLVYYLNWFLSHQQC